MALNTLFCVFGFAMLYYGAEWLVKGSSSLAKSLGITPVVIGLTVVAFGTSAPELVVSVVSSIQGKSMIAIGNAVGSNICNIALVLGVSAIFRHHLPRIGGETGHPYHDWHFLVSAGTFLQFHHRAF